MRCEQVRQALIDAHYRSKDTQLSGTAEEAELRAHLAECVACHALETRELALDRLLAIAEPVKVAAGFDPRFFARLREEKAKRQRRRRAGLVWMLVPIAAAAALLLRPAQAPSGADRDPRQLPPSDLALAAELDLVENIELVRKLDELEAYDVLSQVDESEIERIAKENK